jgi:hypothetical protein
VDPGVGRSRGIAEGWGELVWQTRASGAAEGSGEADSQIPTSSAAEA